MANGTIAISTVPSATLSAAILLLLAEVKAENTTCDGPHESILLRTWYTINSSTRCHIIEVSSLQTYLEPGMW